MDKNIYNNDFDDSSSTSSNDICESDWTNMVAPPTSVTDTQGDIDESTHSDVDGHHEFIDIDPLDGPPLLVDFSILKEEIDNIQQDQQELLSRLDHLANNEMDQAAAAAAGQQENHPHLGFIGGASKVCPYILDDELTGGQQNNASYVHDIINQLQELKNFNQCTYDLLRYVRQLAMQALRATPPETCDKATQTDAKDHSFDRHDKACG